MANSLGRFPSKFIFISWLDPMLNRNSNSNMGRSLWPAEAKHLCFCWRQLNSRCCQHHIILGVPIYMKAALRKVTSLNSWWLNGFCMGNSSPRCVVLAGVWYNLLSYWIRQREKRDHKEIFHFMRASWSHRSCMSCICDHSAWYFLNAFPDTGCHPTRGHYSNKMSLHQPGQFKGITLINIDTVWWHWLYVPLEDIVLLGEVLT